MFCLGMRACLVRCCQGALEITICMQICKNVDCRHGGGRVGVAGNDEGERQKTRTYMRILNNSPNGSQTGKELQLPT